MNDRYRIPYVILLFTAFFPFVMTTLIFFSLSGGAIQIGYLIQKIVIVLLPAVAVGYYIGKRGYSVQRPGPHKKDILIYGLLFGLVVLGAMLVVYFGWLQRVEVFQIMEETVRNKLDDASITTPIQFVFLAAFISFANATFEEYYWRWFLFGQLRSYFSPMIAGVLASIAFTLHHIAVLAFYLPAGSIGWIIFLCSGVYVGGGLWCYVYHKSGTIWAAWVSHVIIDIAIMTIGYSLVF